NRPTWSDGGPSRDPLRGYGCEETKPRSDRGRSYVPFLHGSSRLPGLFRRSRYAPTATNPEPTTGRRGADESCRRPIIHAGDRPVGHNFVHPKQLFFLQITLYERSSFDNSRGLLYV